MNNVLACVMLVWFYLEEICVNLDYKRLRIDLLFLIEWYFCFIMYNVVTASKINYSRLTCISRTWLGDLNSNSCVAFEDLGAVGSVKLFLTLGDVSLIREVLAAGNPPMSYLIFKNFQFDGHFCLIFTNEKSNGTLNLRFKQAEQNVSKIKKICT